MRSAGLAALALLAAACGSTGPLGGVGEVPAFAGAVRVESDEGGELLRARLVEVLGERGLAGIDSTGELAGERARVRASVAESSLVMRAEYAIRQGDELLWRVARNAPGSGQEVFLALVDVAEDLPHERLVFLFEE